ncbi:hypothetical protein [Bradyrhizobium ottawaense]|uniref:hypothetical protein n=1 Tax=Bradyrhizobium ottawaense TaxID=931866 RepID=UPI0030F3830D
MYTPFDWYWLVADALDPTAPYSSKVGDYVLATNPDYQAWLLQIDGSTGRFHVASPMDTEFNMGRALAPYNLRPTPAAVLEGYQAARIGVGVDDPLFPVLVDHENRIRALEGQAPLSRAAIRARFQSLM